LSITPRRLQRWPPPLQRPTATTDVDPLPADADSSATCSHLCLCGVPEPEDRALARVCDCARHRQSHDQAPRRAGRNPHRRPLELSDPEVPPRGRAPALRGSNVTNADAADNDTVAEVGIVQGQDQLLARARIETDHADARDAHASGADAPCRRGLPAPGRASSAQDEGRRRERQQGQEGEPSGPTSHLRSDCRGLPMRRQTQNRRRSRGC
jgi:hypothetical protein